MPAHEFQASFLARIGNAVEIRQLFDHIDGVCFFMRDREGRFIAIGTGPRQDFHHDEETMIGVSVYDQHPQHIAERIREDDHRVMESDRPLLNIIQFLANPLRRPIGWYVVNKYPVHDHAGLVIGIMGTVQPFEGRRKLLLSGTHLDDAINHVEEHYVEALEVGTLARMAGVSERQFRRKIQELLGMSPHDFILRTRLKKACTALTHTQKPVAEIAVDCGFYDQSAMSVQFQRIIGLSPIKYRKRYTDLLVPRCQP